MTVTDIRQCPLVMAPRVEHLVQAGLPVWDANIRAQDAPFIATIIANAPDGDIEQLLATEMRCIWLFAFLSLEAVDEEAFQAIRLRLARYKHSGRARHELAIKTIDEIAGEHC